jgi:hypothetical protein
MGAGTLIYKRIKEPVVITCLDLGPKAIRRTEGAAFLDVVINDIDGRNRMRWVSSDSLGDGSPSKVLETSLQLPSNTQKNAVIVKEGRRTESRPFPPGSFLSEILLG